MKKVAMMQPTFLPWLGYFELIAKSDVFVFCDDFQFVNKSWHQKNKFFCSKNVVEYITVPVHKKGAYAQHINEVQIREDINWRKKFWKGLELTYKKAPFFQQYVDQIKPLLIEPQYNLAKQNILLIETLATMLGLDCQYLCSSHMHVTGARSVLVKNLLLDNKADVFYQAQGSFDYMYEDGIFPLNDVNILFQNADMDAYPQISSTKGFVPYLSVLDALFNVGAERTRELIEHTTKHWLTWDEMVAQKKQSPIV